MESDVEELDVTQYPEWRQAAIDAAKDFSYGDVISHEWLHEHFDIKPPDHGTADDFKNFQFKFLSYVESFKERLLEDNKMLLISQRGMGYLIVQPEEQTTISWAMMKRQVEKELNKANARLSNILLDALSDKAREENFQKQTTLAAIRSMNDRMLDVDNTGGETNGAV